MTISPLYILFTIIKTEQFLYICITIICFKPFTTITYYNKASFKNQKRHLSIFVIVYVLVRESADQRKAIQCTEIKIHFY